MHIYIYIHTHTIFSLLFSVTIFCIFNGLQQMINSYKHSVAHSKEIAIGQWKRCLVAHKIGELKLRHLETFSCFQPCSWGTIILTFCFVSISHSFIRMWYIHINVIMFTVTTSVTTWPCFDAYGIIIFLYNSLIRIYLTFGIRLQYRCTPWQLVGCLFLLLFLLLLLQIHLFPFSLHFSLAFVYFVVFFSIDSP